MTEVEDATDRRVKGMRRLARVLALIWASGWTFTIVGAAAAGYQFGAGYPPQSFAEWIASFSIGSWLTMAVSVLIPWVIAGVAWRWEAVGGVALIVVAVLDWYWLGSIVDMLLQRVPGSPALGPSMGGQLGWALVCLPFALSCLATAFPALGAGVLFLLSWRRSRAPEGPEDTKQDAGRGRMNHDRS